MYSILVIGGGSIIGRNFIQHIINYESDIYKRIRVVDRMLLETGYFTKTVLKAFEKVEYIQGNLSNKSILKYQSFIEFIENIFEDDWDVVYIFPPVLNYGQPEQVIK